MQEVRVVLGLGNIYARAGEERSRLPLVVSTLHLSCMRLHYSAAAPEKSAAAPEKSAAAPESSAAAPESAAAAPESAAAAPEICSTAWNEKFVLVKESKAGCAVFRWTRRRVTKKRFGNVSPYRRFCVPLQRSMLIRE